MKSQIFLICGMVILSTSAQLVRLRNRNRVLTGVKRVCNDEIVLDDGTVQPGFCQDIVTSGVRPAFGTTRVIGLGGGGGRGGGGGIGGIGGGGGVRNFGGGGGIGRGNNGNGGSGVGIAGVGRGNGRGGSRRKNQN